MKKVLLLTCSTGEGHNSAAHAIASAFEPLDVACEIADPVSFKSERASEIVSSVYNNIIRKKPAAFGAIYKLGDRYSATRLPSPIYWANASYAEALRTYIQDNGFDAVICTHLYGMEAMTAIQNRHPMAAPCYGVMTDYTCIPFMGDLKLNGYFVPHAGMKTFLMDRGTPAEHIWVSGIPVNRTFSHPMDKHAARMALSIPDEAKVYLVMTGGIGCENMLGLCDALLTAEHEGLIFVLTGHNEAMKSSLDQKYPQSSQLKTVSFTRQVAAYMAAADVMLSKPGGLSSTEAAVVNVPLVHVDAIPGCETMNAQFFSQHGLSLWARNHQQAATFAVALAHDSMQAETMRAAQRKCINPHAASQIVETVMNRSSH